MEFKRSAGIFVAGVTLLLGGPLLSLIATTLRTYAASSNDGGLSAVSIGLAVFGFLIGFVGIIMIVVAAHRALVKIDAFPVRLQPAQRQHWPTD